MTRGLVAVCLMELRELADRTVDLVSLLLASVFVEERQVGFDHDEDLLITGDAQPLATGVRVPHASPQRLLVVGARIPGEQKQAKSLRLLAVEVGFEPTEELPPHTLSRRA